MLDTAAMSIVLNNSQLRLDASLAMMNQTKEIAQQQGEQFVEMLEKSVAAPHPTHGNIIDVSV